MLSEVHMHDCTLLCIGAGVMQTGHVECCCNAQLLVSVVVVHFNDTLSLVIASIMSHSAAAKARSM